ncbi:MAG: carbamoyltransferase HypF [Gammaproteobacteria bacterium]|nr:carbamoyltransferase HypF [Gammaproteobacteria bacterium]
MMSAPVPLPYPVPQRLRITLTGTVQGVGMRPFIQRMADASGLTGWVRNEADAVVVEVQGAEEDLHRFLAALRDDAPPAARIERIETSNEVVIPTEGFSISAGTSSATPALSIPHDTAPCADCLCEFHDPDNRRFHYPFISCTQCGPRWSVLRAMPYDRANTSFARLPPCAACQAEYTSPAERRFHHQTISCPACGPTLTLLDAGGLHITRSAAVWSQIVTTLAAGGIVAFKSVGGYQLLADATNEAAIARLRAGKRRPAKPFAVLFADLAQAATHCWLDALEQTALCSAARPVVIARSRHELPAGVAPGNGNIGAMLPPSALHEALMLAWRGPLIATSGNVSRAPLYFKDEHAMEALHGIADLFLQHDLPVVHPLDDSVVRVIDGQAVTLRPGRGLAPLRVPLPVGSEHWLLAVGGQQKSTVAVATPKGIYASPYIGELDNTATLDRFTATVDTFSEFAPSRPGRIMHDMHPDYASTEWALAQGNATAGVQHHIAHFFSVLAEHGHTGPALGVCWDGNGLGDDGMLWGGECFVWDGAHRVDRVAHLRPFPLPGGEKAIREPRLQALGLLSLMGMEVPATLAASLSASERHNISIMLQRRINTPFTTSVGRLFDVVAALLGVCHRQRYEADAAMQLECLAEGVDSLGAPLSFTVEAHEDRLWLNWQPMIVDLLAYQRAGVLAAELSAAFHNALASGIVEIAARFQGVPVFLSGGVFQNRLLTSLAAEGLRHAGRRVFSHQRVPPNDSGLAVGQLYYQMACVEAHAAGVA